ncbi:MAG: hypothetical protein LWX52_14990 [Deltaproteobacteria bacterium]|nr:hypothetical protein [Deltaproteobacteria bacterium]
MDTFYCHDIVDSTLINAFCNRLHRLGLCLEELQVLLFDIDNSHHVFELQFWLLDCQRTFVHDVVAVISKINVKSYNHLFPATGVAGNRRGLPSAGRSALRASQAAAPVDCALLAHVLATDPRRLKGATIIQMTKRKKKMTVAQKTAKKKRQKEYMTIFVHGKQKRVKRPPTIDGIPVDEFIRQNADPIWLHQNEMWEYIEQPEDCDNKEIDHDTED